MVNDDLRPPMVSVLSPMGNDISSKISAIRDLLLSMLGHMYPLLFDRGFYSKDLIMSLNQRKMNYLIFVPRYPQVKDEFSSMYQRQKKVILHEFSMNKNGRRVSDSFHPAFLKQIFDHRSDEYYDWCFASNTSDIDLDHIIAKYKFRRHIETMFNNADHVKVFRIILQEYS